ncbi:DUF6934 family protein [Dyadobacter sp. CY312]|uniref:DUF6934 family protein n=1 Tax=Dyadobacter sp. CY312 TaxID=2907303 RepID=UPI001F21A08D|nr:hypothetical protein [Dyadobacter sp. CY312]MCE7042572.1 hypothetical protein [Dyadobacter sp. CY312]
MNEDSYPFRLSRNEFRYEFVSKSERKEVRKVVLFSQTESPEIYNLALLDLLENGTLSDISETNNEDLKTVLSTVYKIIEDFLHTNPYYLVVFRGSDERRQRLYRIAISRELTNLSKKYRILGVIQEDISLFKKNESYDFYLIGNHESK